MSISKQRNTPAFA